ncbi:MAG: tail fiber domain-containing protein [Deltaproteobacteria bacterium]|nr:tail fiber domain-containing protein [Deltaproteobacteria bacterium]
MNHRFAFFFAATAAIASLGAACSASPAPEVPPAPEETGTSEAELSLCKKDLCGPALGMPALLCADGSLGGNTGRCIREKGACHWEIRECPKPPPPSPTDCSAPNACGPAPGIPDQICDDGSVAGAKCVASKSGACGWQITTCPAPAPDKCGKSTCSKGQTCCSGMPFPEPTCVNGTMCPISQRKHKKDVSYLSESDKQRLSDELLGIPLATYRYKSEGEAERTHLGFIIDDIAPSPAVTSTGERVDMYGYATMSVAALQVQAKEIADLRRQIDDLKTELAKSRAPAKR